MKHLVNNKGIALVTALLLTLISLGILMAVVYLITKGTTISGFLTRYSSSLEASYGGVNIMTKEILEKAITGSTLSSLGTYNNLLASNVSDACFTDKLTKKTADWASGCSSTLDPKDNTDIVLTLNGVAGKPDYNIFIKMVDTIKGNSSTSSIALETAPGVVDITPGEVQPKHIPYVYRIEAQGERKLNPTEKSNLTGLYAY